MKNLLIVFSFLFLTPYAFAQSMQGVRDVGLVIEQLDDEAARCNITRDLMLVIEQLDDEAARCNITRDLIDASVRILLSNSRIRLVRNESSLHPYLYVRTSILESSGFCVMAVEMSYNKFASSEKSVGSFWNKGDLITRRNTSSASAVGESIERMTKQFIAAWLREN